jgi:hypothetical protein
VLTNNVQESRTTDVKRQLTARGMGNRVYSAGALRHAGGRGHLGSWAVKVTETRVDVGGRPLFTICPLGNRTGPVHDLLLSVWRKQSHPIATDGSK